MVDRPTPWGDWASSQTLQFTFEVTSDGRAVAGISLRGLRTGMAASYHTDALGDLVRAVTEIAGGALESVCSWDEEPGVYRWHLRRAGDAALVRIIHVDGRRAGPVDVVGHTVWEGTVPVEDLVAAVAGAAREVLARWGVEGYRQAWQTYAFPTDALVALEEHLPPSRRISV